VQVLDACNQVVLQQEDLEVPTPFAQQFDPLNLVLVQRNLLQI
jgi:hypothetical protein